MSVFRHRLLHHFQLTIFCKLPAEPIVTQEDIRYSLMVWMALRSDKPAVVLQMLSCSGRPCNDRAVPSECVLQGAMREPP